MNTATDTAAALLVTVIFAILGNIYGIQYGYSLTARRILSLLSPKTVIQYGSSRIGCRIQF